MIVGARNRLKSSKGDRLDIRLWSPQKGDYKIYFVPRGGVQDVWHMDSRLELMAFLRDTIRLNNAAFERALLQLDSQGAVSVEKIFLSYRNGMLRDPANRRERLPAIS
jgi:hypothetical protein